MDNTIFISYSRADSEFALKLARDLRAVGAKIWIDQLDIPTGARWDNEIEQALDRCGSFMIILSPASASSENVKDEISIAIDKGKNLIPIMHKAVQVPLRLHRFQYIDFTQSYPSGLSKLQALIQNPGKPVESSNVERPGYKEDHQPLPQTRKGPSFMVRAIIGFIIGALCISLAGIIDGYTSLEDVLIIGGIAAVIGIFAYPSQRAVYLIVGCMIAGTVAMMAISPGDDLATFFGIGGSVGAGGGAILSRVLGWAKASG